MVAICGTYRELTKSSWAPSGGVPSGACMLSAVTPKLPAPFGGKGLLNGAMNFGAGGNPATDGSPVSETSNSDIPPDATTDVLPTSAPT